MKIRFEHDISHNYAIPEPENSEKEILEEEEADYEVHMLEENQIRGFMRCVRKRINGKTEYYYEITSRQSLAQICETETLRSGDIRKIFACLYEALQQMNEYLLDGNKLVLDPALIYLDIESRDVTFCYLPSYKNNIQDTFRGFASYLLYHLNQADTEAVLRVYEINRKIQETNYALIEILQEEPQVPDTRVKEISQDQTERSIGRKEEQTVEETVRPVKGIPEKGTSIKHPPKEKKEKQQKNPKKRMQMLTGVIYLVVIGIAGIAAWMELLTVTQAGGITCLITAILAYTLSSEKTGKKKDEQKKNSGVKWELPEVSEERLRQDTEKIPDQIAEEEVGATTLLWKGEEEYKPQLTLISMNPRERNSVVLVKDNYVIGKLKSKADILLEEEGISRVHARIQKEGEEYYLYDMNSTNGTFINGRRLGVNEKVPLHVTDEIAFAKIEYYIGNC